MSHSHNMYFSAISRPQWIWKRLQAKVQLPTPTLLVHGETAVILVVEQQILCSVQVKKAPLALAAYYSFNIEYPKGSLAILEILLPRSSSLVK